MSVRGTAADACAHYITIDRGQSAVDSVFFTAVKTVSKGCQINKPPARRDRGL